MNSDFKAIYKQYFSRTCPPNIDNEKSEGCYNQLNDFGKEPQEKNCRKCWLKAFEMILIKPEKIQIGRGLFDEKHS